MRHLGICNARKRTSASRARVCKWIVEVIIPCPTPYFTCDLYCVVKLAFKATASWQWYNHVEASTDRDKRLVRFNLDETAVCVYQDDRKGHILVEKSSEVPKKVTKGVKRTYLTLVTIVCDDPEIQPFLPQFLIGNEATLKVGELCALQAPLPDNVFLWRRKSAWVQPETMVDIARLLAMALEPFKNACEAILLLDACKSHLTAAVWRAWFRAGIRVVVVPVRMTAWLQPLDTHGFRSFKAKLHFYYQRQRVESIAGASRISLVIAAVGDVYRSDWASYDWGVAFSGNGYGSTQQQLRKRIMEKIGLVDKPFLSAERPSPECVARCLPKKWTLEYGLICKVMAFVYCSDASAILESTVAASAAVACAGGDEAGLDGPISTRTRSKTGA